jgi:hypothetical protein
MMFILITVKKELENMDKYEQLIFDINEMSESDRSNTIKSYKVSCVCSTCATFNECAEGANEKLFCVTGKSMGCITELKGCECPVCPLAQSLDIGVINNSYSLMGSEMEQRGN